MLRFILGGAGSGKSSRLTDLIDKAAENDKRVVVIVPEQFSFDSDKKLYKKLGCQRFNKILSVSFTTAAREIFEKYGSRSLLFGMLLTAFVTGLAHLLLNGSAALLGASGIVFMLILLASFASFRQGTIPMTFLLIAGIYIGNEIITGITTADNISQMSHIIGGACGAFLGCFLNRKGFKSR